MVFSKNKIYGKSKCTISLTKIENKLDLKSEIKVDTKFLLTNVLLRKV